WSPNPLSTRVKIRMNATVARTVVSRIRYGQTVRTHWSGGGSRVLSTEATPRSAQANAVARTRQARYGRITSQSDFTLSSQGLCQIGLVGSFFTSSNWTSSRVTHPNSAFHGPWAKTGCPPAYAPTQGRNVVTRTAVRHRAWTRNALPHSGQVASFPAASSGTLTGLRQCGQICLITGGASGQV